MNQLNADNSNEEKEVRVLNFKEGNIETLTLEELKQTYPERNTDQTPQFNGIFHHELLDRIGSIIEKNGLSYNIEDIFAVDNKKQGRNGVSVNPDIEKIYGQGAINAHALRRVFTTIRINDLENEESNTGLAIAYHQDGIQLGIGPNVKICHNQCILNKERSVATYGGDDKVKDIEKLLQIVDDWMKNFTEHRTHDQKVIVQMKNIQTNYDQVMAMIGHLNTIRVVKDSKEKVLKAHEANLGKTYPLNGAQINQFTERYLMKCIELKTTDMSLWEIYNISTEFYKAGMTDFPNIVTQNIAWAEFLIKTYNL
jgi:hypothetical protein